MKMFLLGMLVMYLIIGIIRLILNTIDVDEDLQDCILGFWLLPVCILYRYIYRFLKRKKYKKRVDK